MSSWEIKINTAKSQNAKILAHEFGHVIGLVDTGCGGLAADYEHCTYNSQNICRKCGTPYGVQPYADGNETVTE